MIGALCLMMVLLLLLQYLICMQDAMFNKRYCKKRDKMCGFNRPTTGGITKRYQPKRGVRTLTEFDIRTETSMDEDLFEIIFSQLNMNTARSGGKKIKTVLSDRTRLLMVFHWLREKPKIRILASKFGISVGSAYAEIKVGSNSSIFLLTS